ncbi:MerR family transcriptional regulator [Aestuariibius sp. 2305UL40-4]|uniref:MerR family transcriptional regulator n=1 Tax=Aestuariibius violaceus TaxID=3234132 RepID=UPI00345E2113
MSKSPDAFRTIGEVSEWLGTPAHVLRFWESKFSQIKPVKRAGGRRYYRPDDMALLSGIRTLLHDEGMAIKEVQQLLKEQGIRHVADFGEDPRSVQDTPQDVVAEPVADAPPAAKPDPTPSEEIDDLGPLFASRNRPAEPAAPAKKSPLGKDLPADPKDIPGKPALLTALARADRTALRAGAAKIAPHLTSLRALSDRLARE